MHSRESFWELVLDYLRQGWCSVYHLALLCILNVNTAYIESNSQARSMRVLAGIIPFLVLVVLVAGYKKCKLDLEGVVADLGFGLYSVTFLKFCF